MKELDKIYDPSIEPIIYQNWLDKKYFHAKIEKDKTPYTIVIPPPNITGQLHMGHALDNTFQDILIRFKRMQGYNALWLPGTDHASISTEVKIVEQMASEGLTKNEIGREGFLQRAWQWKNTYGNRIINQLKKIGCSCDWDRERFTMDEGLSKAVNEVFINLYNKGLIYRGEKLINWCPKCKTTISDAEVNHTDMPGHFWHIKYPVSNTDLFLHIATTRPETMLGDTAVAVHPEDERYKDFIGKSVILPIMGRTIPIIADAYVDREFGTGVVKITPAHDHNDFDVCSRHDLEIINILNDDGSLNENAGKYAGLDRYDAREKIVAELEEMGLLIKIEDISHSVGVHERCNDIVEPLIKLQWFVKMEELAKPAIDVYNNNKLKFIPDRFGKIYLNWLTNIRDWCISRQLWWGHRIPAYYCNTCSNIKVAHNKPSYCEKCGCSDFVQDEDILDTWFSSALWPFATLGWPEQTDELKHFYPTNVLVTGYDIIFFWVVRMVFSGLEHTGHSPFSDVFIHGLMRDSQGRKMSKSLGNGVDPIEIIDKYGADALRLTIVTGNAPGNDMRFYWERVESSRNFANKLWNASRFVLMNLDETSIDSSFDLSSLTSPDRWILSKINTLINDVTENMENYEFGIAVQKIYDFIWNEFCDWFIEMVKPRLYNVDDATRPAAVWTLHNVLSISLKLLHPYMPFITEEIFTHINTKEDTIMLSPWPKFTKEWIFTEAENEIDLIKETIRAIRNIRSEMNVPPSKKVTVYVISEIERIRNIFASCNTFFKPLAHASEVIVDSVYNNIENSVSVVVPSATIYMPQDELVDKQKEIERLNEKRDKLIFEVERIEKKLANKGFISKAPEQVINIEKEKLLSYKKMLEQVYENLART